MYSYHTDSKNLMLARPQPYMVIRINVISLGTENRSVMFAYVKSNYVVGYQTKITAVTTMEIWEDLL